MIDTNKEYLNNLVEPECDVVALHLRQLLSPVEGADAPFFPPTYAGDDNSGGSKYCIDTLADQRKVALVDSVGAQANRIEPLFKEDGAAPELAKLVPQVYIEIGSSESTEDAKRVSIFDIGHRLGDAIVRASALQEQSQAALLSVQKGDITPMVKLAPTSLVFGVWDSRNTQAKLPRIVQSCIRAWDVTELTRSAQYFPPARYADHNVFSEDEVKKADGDNKNPLAKAGYVEVPATNQPGGVVAHGDIRRDITVNLIALRRLAGDNNKDALVYLLGLSLAAATAPMDGFLRQGCLLVPDTEQTSQWQAISRTGQRNDIDLTADLCREFAVEAARQFGVGEGGVFEFDPAKAKEDVKKQKK